MPRTEPATHTFAPSRLWLAQHPGAAVRPGDCVRVVDVQTMLTPSGVPWYRIIMVETRDGRAVACAPSDVRRIR